MPTTFEKLNLKGQREIIVLHAPASFEPELKPLKGITVHRKLGEVSESEFFLVFVSRKAEVDLLAGPIAKIAQGDAVVWFAYPKGTSKKYKCDFNRDNGWDKLQALGWETVRAAAIDEDWSALRFRRSEFVKPR